MAKKTMSDYEAEIGIRPHQDTGGNPTSLNELRAIVRGAPGVTAAIKAWLELDGIPTRNINSAQPDSILLAYTNRNYLLKWRKNTNPQFSALFDGIDGDEEEEVPAQPQAKPAVSLGDIDPQALVDKLSPLIKSAVEADVDAKLTVKDLKLGAEAKQQIKDIASGAGLDAMGQIAEEMREWVTETLAREIPPREVKVISQAQPKGVTLGLTHYKFERLLKACNTRNADGHRLNVWMTGGTGSGKTKGASQVAEALGLRFFAESSLDADYKVYGYKDANGNTIRTMFREAFEHGGVYVADEADNWHPSAWTALNAPLANGFAAFPDGIVKRHPDFICIACANTWGLGATADYVGRNKLDAATLDRFQPKINWDYDEKLELAIAKSAEPLFGPWWHGRVMQVREAIVKQGLKVIISPRATINGIALWNSGYDYEDIVSEVLGAGLSPQQYQAIGLDTIQRMQIPDSIAFALKKRLAVASGEELEEVA